ncbi:MAG TPA: acyloxyacyl hydrolase [Acidobacteriaceae bacterium]|nr:acyloxyacyl hydrolase [Acidobacteriaceae bacterium]
MTLLSYSVLLAQTQMSSTSQSTSSSPAASSSRFAPADYVSNVMHPDPWDRGVFVDGGFGTNDQTDIHFLNAGVGVGKVLTGAVGPGYARGQFEYAVEVMPYWQALTPVTGVAVTEGNPPQTSAHRTGGTYTGVSIVPIILRWNFVHWHRVMPWMQGAGGLIWTDHKFPKPNTSVWNFSPQFGVGIHYFVKPKQSINFAANAEHISSASLGDQNPGVNASVQFQIGYTWWQ